MFDNSLGDLITPVFFDGAWELNSTYNDHVTSFENDQITAQDLLDGIESLGINMDLMISEVLLELKTSGTTDFLYSIS